VNIEGHFYREVHGILEFFVTVSAIILRMIAPGSPFIQPLLAMLFKFLAQPVHEKNKRVGKVNNSQLDLFSFLQTLAGLGADIPDYFHQYPVAVIPGHRNTPVDIGNDQRVVRHVLFECKVAGYFLAEGLCAKQSGRQHEDNDDSC
jgi:hypothetical protein